MVTLTWRAVSMLLLSSSMVAARPDLWRERVASLVRVQLRRLRASFVRGDPQFAFELTGVHTLTVPKQQGASR